MATQLAMLVLRKAGDLSAQKFDFLLRGPQRAGVSNPIVEWLPDSVWASVQALKVRPARYVCVEPDVQCRHALPTCRMNGISLRCVQTT